MQCEACGTQNIDGARFCAKCGALMPLHEEGPDPLVGQLIGGRYRVTGVLGEGGMGKVYVGEQQMGSTIRKVAIKTLHQHLSKDPSVLARFHRECGTVAQLEHPNTIKFFDFGATQDGTLYIAMEFVAGKPLSDVLEKEAPLSPERVVKILRQVCGVLDEAHLQGVIHRDLKPENVVLTNRAGETDFVKVLDFGIAARTEGSDAQKEAKLTQQGMVLGTPPYMSPEQFTGKALDARSDIYSLAVMAYEMLTKKLPFEADTPWQWATQHMTAQPTPFEASAPAANIPPAMRSAILRALSKDRDQRQPSAREFFAELSEGARMTVVSDPQHPATGTAAMAAAPDFGGIPAPTAPSHPIAGGGHPAPRPAPTAPGVAVPAMVAPPPMTSRKSGGGKGLVIGLGALGAVLLVAMAVVAARSMKPDDEEVALTSPLNSSAAAGPQEIKPLETPAPTPTVPEAPAEPSAATPTSTPTHKPTGTKPPTTPTSTTTTTPTTTKPPASSGGGCDACLSAASSGNIAAAAQAYRSCDDAAKKTQCSAAAKRAAPNAALAAANNGQCGAAQAIVAAATGMGAGSRTLESRAKSGSCAK